MTSQERREGRYQRRKAKRQERKQARCDALGPINKVFSYRKMFRYGRKCCNGVRWKQSVQNFELHLFSGTAKRRRQILDNQSFIISREWFSAILFGSRRGLGKNYTGTVLGSFCDRQTNRILSAVGTTNAIRPLAAEAPETQVLN